MDIAMLFLKLTVDGTPLVGDAMVEGYKGQIACESVDWAVSYKKDREMAEGEEQTSLEPKHVEFEKLVDPASPGLYSAIPLDLKEEPRVTALFTMLTYARGSGSDTIPKLMTLELNRCHVRKIDISVSGGKNALTTKETVTLSYEEMTLKYFPYDPKTGSRSVPRDFRLKVKSV